MKLDFLTENKITRTNTKHLENISSDAFIKKWKGMMI